MVQDIFAEVFKFDFVTQFHDMRLHRLARRYAADTSCQHILSMIEVDSTVHDGETTEPAPPKLVSWLPDEDAPAVTLDTWARGSIPVRVQQSALTQANMAEKLMDKRPGSSGSVNNRSMKSTGTLKSLGALKRQQEKEEENKKNARNLPSGLVQEKGSKGNKPVVEDPDDVFRKQIKAKQELARLALQKEEAELMAHEKLDRLAREAKGKDFTFDSKGEMMVITNIEADRLPLSSVAPKLAVLQRENQEDPNASLKSKQLKQAKEEPIIFYKPLDTQVPTVYQSINLVAGVSLREGQRSKSGGAKEGDSYHMSRKQFNAKFDTYSLPSLAETAPADKKSGKSAEEIAAAAAVSQTAPARAGDDPPSSSRVNVAAPTDKPGTGAPSTDRSLGATGGAGKLRDKTRNAPPSSSGQTYDSYYDWASPPKLSQNAGVVPQGAQPHKTSIPARPAQPSSRRERPHVAPLAQSHLPAPLYPANTGHGFQSPLLSRVEGQLSRSRNSDGGEEEETGRSSSLEGSRRKGHFSPGPPSLLSISNKKIALELVNG